MQQRSPDIQSRCIIFHTFISEYESNCCCSTDIRKQTSFQDKQNTFEPRINCQEGLPLAASTSADERTRDGGTIWDGWDMPKPFLGF